MVGDAGGTATRPESVAAAIDTIGESDRVVSRGKSRADGAFGHPAHGLGLIAIAVGERAVGRLGPISRQDAGAEAQKWDDPPTFLPFNGPVTVALGLRGSDARKRAAAASPADG